MSKINFKQDGTIKIQTVFVGGFEGALIGMRAPLLSYDKYDSHYDGIDFVIENNDMKLLTTNLIPGGPEHRKCIRMIHVQAFATMPRYWWSEYDTYKVGTTANSESTMHRLLNNKVPITKDQFFFNEVIESEVLTIVEKLEILRKLYKGILLEPEEIKKYPSFIVEVQNLTKNELLVVAKRILPECYLQSRMIDLNYENLYNIYHQRKNHRLKDEWGVFCGWISTLPYAKELIMCE